MSKNTNYLNKKFSKIKDAEIIFIGLLGRSGSFFLGGLLDSSKNLLNFNPYLDSNILLLLTKLSKTKNHNNKIPKKILMEISKILNENFKIIKKFSLKKINFDKENLKIKKMTELFEYLIQKNRKFLNIDLVIKIFYFVYSITFLKNKNYSRNTKILINIHGSNTYKNQINFLENIKKYKYIFTCRDHIKSIDSHYKYTYKNSNQINFLFLRILTQYKISLSHIYKDYIFNKIFKNLKYFEFVMKINKYKIYKNFYFVSFERLHLYPKKSMKSICKALGLHYSPINLRDTISGHRVYFVGQKTKMIGFSKNQANNHQVNFMNSFEKKTVEIVFKDEIKLFNHNSSCKKHLYNFFYLISLFMLRVNSQKGNLTKSIIKFIVFDIFSELKMLLNSIAILILKNPIDSGRIKFLN